MSEPVVSNRRSRPFTVRRPWGRLPAIYPVLLSGAWMINVWSASSAPIEALGRPIALVVAAILLVQLPVTTALGRERAAIVVALALWWMAFGASTAFLVAVIGWAGWEAWALWGRARRQHFVPMPGRRLTSALNLFGGLTLMFTGVTAFEARLRDPSPTGQGQQVSLRADHRPDIFILLLDGYPRADMLMKHFQYSNEGFLNALEARGFAVANRSESNYMRTWLTLASLLNMRHVPDMVDIASVPADESSNQRLAQRLIDNSSVLSALRQANYQIAFLPSPVPNFGIPSDLRADSGHLTSFEVHLIGQLRIGPTVLAGLRDPIADQLRARFAFQQQTLERLADSRSERPRFVLAHVMSPHPPFLFGPDGEARPLPDCFPRACQLLEADAGKLGTADEAYAKALSDQLTYLNAEVLDIVDQLITATPPPVVILMSDHGSRFDPANSPEEQFATLFAAYTPGITHPFSDDVSTVNVFSQLLRAYFSAQLEDEPNAKFESADGASLQLTPVQTISR